MHMKRQHKVPDSHNYEAAYKKQDSGELLWVSCNAKDSAEADKLMDTHVASNHANKGYRRYAGALLIKKHLPTTA